MANGKPDEKKANTSIVHDKEIRYDDPDLPDGYHKVTIIIELPDGAYEAVVRMKDGASSSKTIYKEIEIESKVPPRDW